MKICHMTSIHKRYDARILQTECVSLISIRYEIYGIKNRKKEV